MTTEDHINRIGTHVMVGSDIPGVIEQVIFSRNHTSPLYLVHYWMGGEPQSHRFWPTECLPAPGRLE